MVAVRTIDTSIDLLRVLTWQRNNAVRLQGLIALKQEWYAQNVSSFWDDWRRDVFTLDTANDFGLSVWAIILDQPLLATIPATTVGKPVFGFGPFNKNFGRGNFARATAGTATLSTEQRRTLLKMRYLKLISRGTIPEINAALALLSGGQGSAWVVRGADPASLIAIFDYTPDAGVRFVLDNLDVIPRPAGVGMSIVYPYLPWGVSPTETGSAAHQNFFNATLAETA